MIERDASSGTPIPEPSVEATGQSATPSPIVIPANANQIEGIVPATLGDALEFVLESGDLRQGKTLLKVAAAWARYTEGQHRQIADLRAANASLIAGQKAETRNRERNRPLKLAGDALGPVIAVAGIELCIHGEYGFGIAFTLAGAVFFAAALWSNKGEGE